MAHVRKARREFLARIPQGIRRDGYMPVPVLLADEMDAMFESRAAPTPEQALLGAVLSQAIIDLRTARFSAALAEQARQVREWVCGGYSATIAFETCCDALRIDSVAAREKLLAICPDEELQDRRFASRGLGHQTRHLASLGTRSRSR